MANDALEAVYPKRRSRSKLDGYAELLASWLKRESARGRKERRNLKQLHGELMKLGHAGSSKVVSSPWLRITTSTFFAAQMAKTSSAPKRSSLSL